ncbi:co-chaperone YbbN [Natronoglycomyces albus]|uniref:Tetratricopeptide repeat protein n=1 Tax=Natronoglycomyces albus TaxID=2811108 RepID=A0A895XP51_9ACTN|nr:tetratricopeptide repeat protein [Natronoglycomyces albus]QSB04286.1 tetratricopeptide repeat protein [Natronoglycomyces albus]
MSDSVPSRFSSSAIDLSALGGQPPAPPAGAEGQPTTSPSAPDSGVVSVDITDATAESEVLQRSLNTLVVVVFWAAQSAESVQAKGHLEQLAAEAQGAWTLAKADVQSNQQLAAALQLQALPAVVAIAGGRPVDLIQGPQTEQGLRQWLNKLASEAGTDIPQQVDPELAAAENAMVEGDLDEAQKAYNNYLKNNPASSEAEAGLAQVQLLRRAERLESDAVAKADANPHDIDLALAAADLQVLSGQAEAGYQRLITLIGRLFGDDKERVRKHLVDLFRIAGNDDETVMAARRKLSAVLF